jgi:2-polyprenyl-6-methoxyphenol hydroxylase-like FAD-dependent oxidoreductase
VKNGNILISGASIAGPALAYWLRRYGFNCTIVERAPALREGGYKIDIRGAAIDVAERMDILAEIRQRNTGMRGTSFVNRVGKRIATMDADLFGGRAGDDVEIMRGDLAHILYEATRQNTEYLFDDSITSISQHEAGVDVGFAHNPPRRFDLVVGADGLHSNVRALAFGQESTFIQHLNHYIAIFSIPNYLNLDRWELMHAAPGKTAGIYSTRQHSDAKAMFIFAAPPLEYDRRDSAQQKQILAKTFAAEGWEVPQMLKHMAAADDFYFDSISQVRMECWSKGRVVLVGDAAYGPSPASGQGTSLALVGAYVLAGELATAANEHMALCSYEREMRAFVEQNQRLAPENLKGMVLHSRPQIWFQTQMIRLLPHLPAKDKIIGRIADAIHSAATAITLKNYL